MSERRRRRPVMTAALTLLAVFLVITLLVALGGDDPSGSSAGLIGEQVPDVELVTLDGQPFRLSQLDGQRVMINFFNDWCAPCQQELPDILAFNAAHAGDPSFTWVWIARDYEVSAIRGWVERVDPPGIVLLDPGEDASEAFRTVAQPETYAVRADGVVTSLIAGPATAGELDDMLLSASTPAGDASEGAGTG